MENLKLIFLGILLFTLGSPTIYGQLNEVDPILELELENPQLVLENNSNSLQVLEVNVMGLVLEDTIGQDLLNQLDIQEALNTFLKYEHKLRTIIYQDDLFRTIIYQDDLFRTIIYQDDLFASSEFDELTNTLSFKDRKKIIRFVKFILQKNDLLAALMLVLDQEQGKDVLCAVFEATQMELLENNCSLSQGQNTVFDLIQPVLNNFNIINVKLESQEEQKINHLFFME